jgi:molybdopterin-guanine dinucleotide biosynthesis protein
MKSVLILGKTGSGKTSTIEEVCKRLCPTEVYKLCFDTEGYSEFAKGKYNAEKLDHHTCIIDVRGKLILIIDKALDEKTMRLKSLLDFCTEINIDIAFLLRSETQTEQISETDTDPLPDTIEILASVPIDKIPVDDFINHQEWNNRVDSIVSLIEENI